MTDRATQQRRALQSPDLDRLWQRARQRIEESPNTWTGDTFRLSHRTEAERAALDRLLGPCEKRERVVSLSELDIILREGPLGMGLPAWLTELSGPLRDRPAEAVAERARIAAVAAALAGCRHDGAGWFGDWRRRVEEQKLPAERVHAAVSVLDRLPAALPRMELASAITADPKALEGGPLAALVEQALALWFDCEDPREAWAQAGIYGERSSSRVLVLGLQPRGTSPLETYLRAAAEQRHPVVLSLHDVERLTAFSTAPVFVCENPSVLERAAAEGVGCALICTEGRPHVAAWRLLIRLAETGASLQVQADFDPTGLSIVGAMISRLGAKPWRMDLATYVSALRPEAPHWSGNAAPRSPWDLALEERMRQTGKAVFEEQVMELLLGDLGANGAQCVATSPAQTSI